MMTVSTCSTSTRSKRVLTVLRCLRVNQGNFECIYMCGTALSINCAGYLSISLKAFGASDINTKHGTCTGGLVWSS